MDYLFSELSEEEATGFEQRLEEDTAESQEVSSLQETLALMRTLEAEQPPDWLAAKVLAEARQVAETTKKNSLMGRLRRFLWGPVGGLVGAGALATMLAVVVTPRMLAEQAAPTPDEVAFDMGARELKPSSAPPSGTLAVAPADAPAAEEAEVAASADEFEPSEASARAESKGVQAGRDPETRSAERSRAKRSAARRARPRADLAQAPTRVQDDGADEDALAGALGSSAAGRAGPSFGDAPKEVPAAPAPAAGPAVARAPRAPSPAPEAEPAPPPAPKAKADASKDAPAQLAQELIRAARQELARGQIDSARAVLTRGAERLHGHPSRGWIFVERGRLELNQGELPTARRYARAALGVVGFEGHPEARRLLAEIARAEPPAASAAPAEP